MIVALDADKTKALQMIGQLAAEHPKLPILTISRDSQALLQSLQRGAKYFLTHPVGAGRPARAPCGGRSASTPATEPDAAGRRRSGQKAAGQIIAVLGSRGGVGCTSLAVNLAATLAADPDNAVALIDLDLALGDADIALELTGHDNIAWPTWP